MLSPDARFVVRSLRRRPLGVAAAVSSLAFAVALNITVFTAVRDAYWAPLPYGNEDRLVAVTYGADDDSHTVRFLTGNQLMAVRRIPGLFEQVASIECWPASHKGWTGVTLATGTIRVSAGFVTPNLFDVLGVRAARGRTFSGTDVTTAGRPAVVSDRFFRETLAGRPDVLGSELAINQVPHTVVGVLPPGIPPPLPEMFRSVGHRDIDVWALQDADQLASTEGGRAFQYRTIALLNRRVTSATLAEASKTLNRSLEAAGLGKSGAWAVQSLKTDLSSPDQQRLTVLFWLSMLLLATGCANLVTIEAARSLDHVGHLAIRSALGASRWQLWRVPVIEAAGVAATGTMMGWLASWWGQGLLLSAAPSGRWTTHVGLGGGTVAFCGAVAIVAVGCGLGGVFAVRRVLESRSALVMSMASGPSPGVQQWHDRMVQVQVFVLLVLVTPTLGLWRGVSSVANDQPLSARADVLVAEAWMLERFGTEFEPLVRLQDRLAERARTLPGVRRVGTSSQVPLQEFGRPNYIVTIPGARAKRVYAYGAHVDTEYFAVLRTAVLAGRVFDGTERPDRPLVAVVSDSFARQAFGDVNVVGREIDWHGHRTIIGVVEDQGFGRTLGEPRPAIFIARREEPSLRLCLFVELSDTGATPGALRGLTRLDADQPIDVALPLPAVLDALLEKQRSYAFAARALAVVGGVIALVGLFVAVEWFVVARARSMTIRMVLGATPGRVICHVLGRYAVRLGPAVLFATPAAIWVCSRIESLAEPMPVPAMGPLVATSAVTALVCIALVAAAVRGRIGTGVVLRD